MRGSFDDLDTFITKARFLAIMIMDKKNPKHHDNNAFYPTCAPNPHSTKFGNLFLDSEFRFAFVTVYLPIIGIAVSYSRMTVLLKKSYKILGNVPHLNARIRSQKLERAVIRKFIAVFLAYLLTIVVYRLFLLCIPKNVTETTQTTFLQDFMLEYGKLLLLIEPTLNPWLYPLLSGSFRAFYRDLKKHIQATCFPSFLRSLWTRCHETFELKSSLRINPIELDNLT
ncbi:unnamed protein product [Oikopleura dioica]|uniref:G-protein coupled receptors family 1 profile domain-containing protein n=1 Tax=Oikopleura dioica TaxID=34765 RepID=E4Y9E0_OIKDI|nr:unnamed protein product [Oikopleura dioica]